MTPRRLIEPARLASTALLRGQTDARLVDLTRAGNEQAFEAIVHRYRRPLLRYCGRILPPGRAEDAVQQAFLSAYRAIRDGDNDLLLRPWLYRVARNSALNLLRQNGWNHEQLHEDMDGVMRPDQAVEGRERIRSLVASVKGLPERQRDAIVLRELEGRSYEEIAVALGVTDGAVRQLLNRARNTLRAGATALTPYGLAERIAEIAGGAGGVASLAKVGAAVLVAGAAATGGVEHAGQHQGASRQAASAVDRRPSTVDRGSPFAVRRGPEDPSRPRHAIRRRTANGERRTADVDGGRRHEGSAFVENLPTRDDGSGSSGGGGSSGPGGGGDQLMTTSSGDGSGSSGSGSSGSGSSGSGSDTSGAGTSGSGSSDGGSTTTTTSSTSGTSGSGDGSGDLSTSGGGTSGESH